MTPEWQYLIHLYDCDVTGKPPTPPETEINYEALLRQAYDFALYYSKNHDAIDVAQFWQLLEECSLDGLISAVLSLFLNCGCLDAKQLPEIKACDEKCVQALSEDLERYSIRQAKPERTRGAWEYFCAQPRNGQNHPVSAAEEASRGGYPHVPARKRQGRHPPHLPQEKGRLCHAR